MAAESSDLPRRIHGDHDARECRIALAVSDFNPLVSRRLVEQATAALVEQGADAGELTVAHVPGAFELPLIAKRLALTRRYDAVICLGAVIRGETSHYDLICEAAARGISQASLETGVPIIFGVLTTETLEQALERSAPGERNRGRAAALAAIEMVSVIRKIKA